MSTRTWLVKKNKPRVHLSTGYTRRLCIRKIHMSTYMLTYMRGGTYMLTSMNTYCDIYDIYVHIWPRSSHISCHIWETAHICWHIRDIYDNIYEIYLPYMFMYDAYNNVPYMTVPYGVNREIITITLKPLHVNTRLCRLHSNVLCYNTALVCVLVIITRLSICVAIVMWVKYLKS